jgi:hypothetical protein
MTRKDYVLIAATIKNQFTYYEDLTPEAKALKELALRMAYEFTLDNPRFEYARFLEACGVK